MEEDNILIFISSTLILDKITASGGSNAAADDDDGGDGKGVCDVADDSRRYQRLYFQFKEYKRRLREDIYHGNIHESIVMRNLHGM